jgi:hypothetical protein
MEPTFPPPHFEPPPPPAPHLPPRTVSVSELEWQSARARAGEWHAARTSAAQYAPQAWVSVTAAPVPSRGRRAAVMATLALIGVSAGVTAAVVVRDEPAEAFSLQAATVHAQDTSTLSFTMEMEMSDGTEVSADISMDVERELMAMHMRMPELEGEFDFIVDLDDNTMYLSTAAEAFDFAPLDGAEWIEADLDELMDVDMSSMLDQVDSNPLDMTAAFADAEGVRDLGYATVDGVEAKHYEVTVDTAEAYEVLDDVLGTVPDELVFDVYISEDNQLLRMAYEFEMMGDEVAFDLTITGTDDVDIVVPDPSTVISFEDLGV